MTVAQNVDLPAAWVQAIQRHAPDSLPAFLADTRRYLIGKGPERVPAGREVDTLKNLIAAYVPPEHREAVVYELAVSSLQRPSTESVELGEPRLAGLLGVGSIVAAGIVLARRRR